jgi:ethanolamine ammonia-lyase small subunit
MSDDPTAAPIATAQESQAAEPARDPWTSLRRFTPARIALGRAGTSLPTDEVLRFAGAHAQARDAVHLPLDVDTLADDLRALGFAPLRACSRAATRAQYLARPDLGRRLDDASCGALAPSLSLPASTSASASAPGLCVVIGDGLSAVAAQSHAAPLLAALRQALDVPIAHVVIATQARVALGDEIGALLGAPQVLMLLGERPGLSSPDSLGAYLTWAPAVGCADSQRNCVSNIRPQGLPLAEAAARLAWLVRESARRRVTGIELKDDSAIAAVVETTTLPISSKAPPP